jgi:hypothetical protein
MRVGDAARRVGTSARMLRYAEQLGLVAPPRTAGGYRDYGERDLLAAAGRPRAPGPLRGRPRPPWPSACGRWRTPRWPVAAPLARSRAGTRGAAVGTDPGPVTALDFETAKARRLLRLAS